MSMYDDSPKVAGIQAKPGLVETVSILEKTVNELYTKVSGSPVEAMIRGEDTPVSGVIDASINKIQRIMDVVRDIDRKLIF